MAEKKKIRNKGKIKFSEYFKKLKVGDRVSISREISENPTFPKRYQGRTGEIKGSRGRSYLVEIKDSNKLKTFIIEPIHLKKIKTNLKK